MNEKQIVFFNSVKQMSRYKIRIEKRGKSYSVKISNTKQDIASGLTKEQAEELWEQGGQKPGIVLAESKSDAMDNPQTFSSRCFSNQKRRIKMIVCQIANNLLGQVNEVETLEEAIAVATQIIQENGVTITDEVTAELENDFSFLSDDGEWSVCIGTPE
jgi:hypothetical protein